MFTSYNNERNQHGGVSLNPLGSVLDPPDEPAAAYGMGISPGPPSYAAPGPPSYAALPDCPTIPIEYIMNDNGNFYKVDAKGFVDRSTNIPITTPSVISSAANDDIKELLENCINGQAVDKCQQSLDTISGLIITIKTAIRGNDQMLVLYFADVLINKYKFKKIINPTTIRSDPKPPTYILETAHQWLVHIDPVYRGAIGSNKNLMEFLECIVQAINYDERLLNPHKVPNNPNNQYRDKPYAGHNGWLFSPTQPIDYKERCYKVVKRCENLFTSDLASFKSALSGFIIPYNRGHYFGGSDQIGGTSFVDKQKIINQLKNAGPWFRQLFDEFKSHLAGRGQTLAGGDEITFNKLIDQYEEIRKSLDKHVGIMLNSINENTGNDKEVTFNSLNKVTSEKINKKLADCEKSMGTIFTGFHTMIGYM